MTTSLYETYKNRPDTIHTILSGLGGHVSFSYDNPNLSRSGIKIVHNLSTSFRVYASGTNAFFMVGDYFFLGFFTLAGNFLYWVDFAHFMQSTAPSKPPEAKQARDWALDLKGMLAERCRLAVKELHDAGSSLLHPLLQLLIHRLALVALEFDSSAARYGLQGSATKRQPFALVVHFVGVFLGVKQAGKG